MRSSETPRNPRKWGRSSLCSSWVLMMGAVVLAACGPGTAAHPNGVRHAVRPQVSPTPDPLLAQARTIAGPAAPPSRLVIPAIGVDAMVEPVGLDDQGRMAAPAKTTDVGWYQLGAAPGDAGDAVMDGHLDWWNGPAVFWRLSQLRVGDRVTVVRADGTRVDFLVDSSRTVPYDASLPDLFTEVGPPTLTLITCAGAWDAGRATYLQRLVVHASLASQVLPPPSSPP
jgi:sortase (surface protein transpeptidase)